jgi:hypothetical protein
MVDASLLHHTYYPCDVLLFLLLFKTHKRTHARTHTHTHTHARVHTFVLKYVCARLLRRYAFETVDDMIALASLIQDIWSDVPVASRPGLYGPSTDACTDPKQLAIIANITDVPGIKGFTFHSCAYMPSPYTALFLCTSQLQISA